MMYLYPAKEMRNHLEDLHEIGEIDSGELSSLRNNVRILENFSQLLMKLEGKGYSVSNAGEVVQGKLPSVQEMTLNQIQWLDSFNTPDEDAQLHNEWILEAVEKWWDWAENETSKYPNVSKSRFNTGRRNMNRFEKLERRRPASRRTRKAGFNSAWIDALEDAGEYMMADVVKWTNKLATTYQRDGAGAEVDIPPDVIDAFREDVDDSYSDDVFYYIQAHMSTEEAKEFARWFNSDVGYVWHFVM